MTTVIAIDESKLRDKEREPARVLLAKLNTDEDFGRMFSLAVSQTSEKALVTGAAGDVAAALGMQLLVSAAGHMNVVAHRRELAAVFIRRARPSVSLRVRHWSPPQADVALVVLCTPYGVIVAEARRQLGAVVGGSTP